MATGRENQDEVLRDGIAKANSIIDDLCARDGVDTRAYGLMVRKAGEMSLALHPGLHPSEIPYTAADGKWDPRKPRAEVGLNASGTPKKDLRERIEDRHTRLVQLHLWAERLAGRTPRAGDMRWDPVLLSLLRRQGADLDRIAAAGPGDFVNPTGKNDRPYPKLVVENESSDDTPYIATVDGDRVRVDQIRFAPGVFYSWSRERPDEVRLSARNFTAPITVTSGLIGEPFSKVVGHPALGGILVGSATTLGKDLTIRGASMLVSAYGI